MVLINNVFSFQGKLLLFQMSVFLHTVKTCIWFQLWHFLGHFSWSLVTSINRREFTNTVLNNNKKWDCFLVSYLSLGSFFSSQQLITKILLFPLIGLLSPIVKTSENSKSFKQKKVTIQYQQHVFVVETLKIFLSFSVEPNPNQFWRPISQTADVPSISV